MRAKRLGILINVVLAGTLISGCVEDELVGK